MGLLHNYTWIALYLKLKLRSKFHPEFDIALCFETGSQSGGVLTELHNSQSSSRCTKFPPDQTVDYQTSKGYRKTFKTQGFLPKYY